MSLIHKMLRELEDQTQKNNFKHAHIPNDYIIYQSTGFSKNTKIVWLGLCGILLVASILTFVALKEKQFTRISFQKIDKLFFSKIHFNTSNSINKPVEVKKVLPLDPKDESDLLYQQATDFIEMGNISQAADQLQKAVQLNPTFQKAREALIVLLIQQQHFNQANLVVNQGLQLSPDNIPFIKLKAHILIALQRFNDALTLLTQNAVSLRQNPDYYELMAVAYEKYGNYIAAARVYNDLLQVQPYNGNFWFGLGVSLQNADKKEAAREAFQKALKTDNLNPKLRAYLQMRTYN